MLLDGERAPLVLQSLNPNAPKFNRRQARNMKYRIAFQVSGMMGVKSVSVDTVQRRAVQLDKFRKIVVQARAF